MNDEQLAELRRLPGKSVLNRAYPLITLCDVLDHIDGLAARLAAAERVVTAARNKIDSDNGCLDVSSGYASDRLWEDLQAYDTAREGHHAE